MQLTNLPCVMNHWALVAHRTPFVPANQIQALDMHVLVYFKQFRGGIRMLISIYLAHKDMPGARTYSKPNSAIRWSRHARSCLQYLYPSKISSLFIRNDVDANDCAWS